MHKGRTYPFHDDLWAVSAWFWPAYVPRKVRLLFYPGQPGYWGPLSGYDHVSDVGVVLADRETVEYSMPLIPGLTSFTAALTVAFAGTKGGSWYFGVNGPAFSSLAGANRFKYAPIYDTVNSVWPTGPAVDGSYIPPDLVMSFALWSEV